MLMHLLVLAKRVVTIASVAVALYVAIGCWMFGLMVVFLCLWG